MSNDKETFEKLCELIGDGFPLGVHHPGGAYVKYPGKGFNRICIGERHESPRQTFSLFICAGDTCAQARELFESSTEEITSNLISMEWKIESNFHLAWQRKNVFRTTGDKELPVGSYIDYWKKSLAELGIRQYKKHEFIALKAMLKSGMIMNEQDINNFDIFLSTRKYQTLITCPGIVYWKDYSKQRIHEGREQLINELKIDKSNFIAAFSD